MAPLDRADLINKAAAARRGNNESLDSVLRGLIDGKGYAEYAGTPYGNLTPKHVGQWCLDTTNSAWYRATTIANTGWSVIGISGLTLMEIRALDTTGYVTQFDDFIGDVLADQWHIGTSSNGTGALVEGVGGLLRLTTGSAAQTAFVSHISQNGVCVDTFLNFRTDVGLLEMECKVKIDTIADVALFVGFTDQRSALELPIYSDASANTTTWQAADAVGILFDTGMSTDVFYGVGNANGTEVTPQNLTDAPVADTYRTLKVSITAAGVATFWIDGTSRGSVAAAVTITAPLTPVVAIAPRGSAARLATIDWIRTQQPRA